MPEVGYLPQGMSIRTLSRPGRGTLAATAAFFPVAVAACEDRIAQIEYPAPGVPIVQLAGEETLSTTAPVTFAMRIAADPASGRLVMLDFYADEPVVVMEGDGSVVTRLGGRGKGPGEFEDTRSVTINRGRAYIWDGTLQRVSHFDVAAPETPTTIPPMTDMPVANGVVPLSSGDFLLAGHTMTDLGALADAQLTRVLPWGSVPPIMRAAAGRDERRKRLFDRSSFAINEALDVAAVGYTWLGDMVFARISSGETFRVQKVGSWPLPRLEPENPFAVSDDTFAGYESVKGTPEAVWGLCVCNTRTGAYTVHPYGKRDIHMFTWEGELVRIYRLTRGVADIAVLGDWVYGLVNNPFPAVVRWPLPPDWREIETYSAAQ